MALHLFFPFLRSLLSTLYTCHNNLTCVDEDEIDTLGQLSFTHCLAANAEHVACPNSCCTSLKVLTMNACTLSEKSFSPVFTGSIRVNLGTK